MNIKVNFSENNLNADAAFAEDSKSFGADVGQVTVLHDGQNGATFTPSVSADGVLSWTNDRELPNPAPVNIKGEKGEKGDKGETGAKGDPGEQGVRGEKGEKGDPGTNGKDGINGKDGQPGKDGANGQPGKDGVDGKTPVRGKDYFTEADKAEMVSAVISALPVYSGEVVSA